ncbi:MAG: forkhead-associated protein, partial [Chloroflexales bacterium]|nr:forkhead-associated protein [Chloroflexales bacterium]
APTRTGSSGDATGEPNSLSDTAVPAPTREPATGGADWTVLVYIDADNDLESYSVEDFNEMEQVGSSDRVNVVAQFDRISSNEAWDDSSNGDWTSTKRFLLQRDDDDETFGSKELEDLGELNMGDPKTLADFVAWGVKAYPAKRYALIISDHGSSWQGIASDETDNNALLSLPDLDAALKNAQREASFGKLDLIGFDACLMAQVDVLQTAQPYARVAVASAELEPGTGWAWHKWLQSLVDEPGQDAASVSKVIIDTYIDSYKDDNDERLTLSSWDLEQFDSVVSGVDALAQAMDADMASSYTAIGEARSYAEAYAQPQPEEVNAIDLGHFAQLLRQQGAGSAIASAAEQLESALDAARIAEGHARLHTNSTGISVFFPQLEELYDSVYEQASPLPVRTKWATFLKSFYSASSNNVGGKPAISNLQFGSDTVSVNEPLSFQGTVSGQNLAYVFFFAGTPLDDNTVQLLSVDFVYPPGTTSSGDIPNWNDGDNDVNYTWAPLSWNMTNGSDQIAVLVGPVKYGTDSYGVEGTYTSKRTGEQIDVGLLFRVSAGRGELQRIWGFPRGQEQDLQPFELNPEAGDTFTAKLRTYADKDGKLKPGVVSGEQITFSEQPMEVFTAPAPSGDKYVAGLLVRDVSGQFDYQFNPLTIDNSGAGQTTQPTPAPTPADSQTGDRPYRNDDLKFSLSHPADWQPNTPGTSRVVFASPEGDKFLSVGVYSLNKPAADANRDILEQLVQVLEKEPGFAQRTQIEGFQLAGQDGLTMDFVYQNDVGAPVYVSATTVTNPMTGLTYLVTIEAPEATYNGTLPTFNAMLSSFAIE